MARTTALPLPRPRSTVSLPLLGALALAIIAGILYATGALAQVRQRIPGLGQPAATYQTTVVSPGNLSVTVTATGPVSAINNLPLSFKGSGKLTALKASVGDQVTTGQVLAVLDTSDLQNSLDQAKSSLAQAQANLAKVQSGPTSAQIAVAQTSVDNAQQSAAATTAALATTQNSVSQDQAAAQNSVSSAQTSLNTASSSLAAAQDQEAKGLASDQTSLTNAQKNLDAVKANVAANVPVLQLQLEKAKNDLWATQINRDAACGHPGTSCNAGNASVAAAQTGLNTAQAQIPVSQQTGQQQIQQAQASLDSAKSALANDKSKFDASIVSAHNQVKQAQASLAAAETGVAQSQAKAATTIQSTQAQITQANDAVKSAQAAYNQSVAPPLAPDIDSAKAQVANAQSAVQTAQANFDAATLTAPFDGTVAAVNGTVGQFVTGGAPGNSSTNGGSAASATAVITLIKLDNLQVTAQVNEADVGKVKIGDPVTFNVSAYPDAAFTGKVIAIQPVGTTVQNVVNYNVTSSISAVAGTNLYPGMTATANIVADSRNGVLLIPDSAITFAQTAIRSGLVQINRGGAQGAAGQGTPTAQGQRQRTAGQTGGQGQAAGQGAAASGQPGGAAASGQTGGANANRAQVLVMLNGVLTPVRVTLGLNDGTTAEVVSGLNAGDAVVVSSSGGTGTGSTTRPATGGPGPGGGGGGGPVGAFRVGGD